jgi:hypothetical protein
MATPAVVHTTLEEYLATDYNPDREWIAGELRKRNVGIWEHARVLAQLAAWLGAITWRAVISRYFDLQVADH